MKLLSCYDQAPLLELSNDHHLKVSIAMMAASVAAIVVAILGMTSVLNLNSHLVVGLFALGGALGFMGTLLVPMDGDINLDTTGRKIALFALYFLAASAIVLGSLGISGQIAPLGGNIGTIVTGSGALLFFFMSSTYSCRCPVNLVK